MAANKVLKLEQVDILKTYIDQQDQIIKDDLTDHIDDTVKHITAEERETWNNKQNALIAGEGIKIEVTTSTTDTISANYEENSVVRDILTSNLLLLTPTSGTMTVPTGSLEVGDSAYIKNASL